MAHNIYTITFQYYDDTHDGFVERSTSGTTLEETKQKARVIAQRFGDGWFDIIRIINPLTKEDHTPQLTYGCI